MAPPKRQCSPPPRSRSSSSLGEATPRLCDSPINGGPWSAGTPLRAGPTTPGRGTLHGMCRCVTGRQSSQSILTRTTRCRTRAAAVCDGATGRAQRAGRACCGARGIGKVTTAGNCGFTPCPAPPDLWPETPQHRDRCHERVGVFQKPPRTLRPRIPRLFSDVMPASTNADAANPIGTFVAEIQAKYTKATDCPLVASGASLRLCPYLPRTLMESADDKFDRIAICGRRTATAGDRENGLDSKRLRRAPRHPRRWSPGRRLSLVHTVVPDVDGPTEAGTDRPRSTVGVSLATPPADPQLVAAPLHVSQGQRARGHRVDTSPCTKGACRRRHV